LSSRPRRKKGIEAKPLTTADYQRMIECWGQSELPIKIEGRESEESIEEEMRHGGTMFFGAIDGDALVGLVIANYDGRRGWINRLAVIPQYRKHGVASTLISKAEEFLKSKGAKVIAALVSRTNTSSRRLLEKNGYKSEEDILYYAKRESAEA
jgi:ribosomal protein S18 acetylase RimI-like enzyme